MGRAEPEYVVEIEERLRQVAGIVRRKGRAMLEGYGVTSPQFDALVILNAEGDLTIGELGARLFLAYSTTTDLVDRLERAKFVTRSRDLEDRRIVRVHLEEPGSAVIERVLEARRTYLADVLQVLDEAERKRVLGVLDLLHEQMAR